MAEEPTVQEEDQEQKKLTIKERFKKLGTGLRRRLPQFTIVSLVGFGINTLAVFLTEVIMRQIWPSLGEFYITIGGRNLFSYSIIGFIALTMGIGAATASNFLLNKFWTFKEAKEEHFVLQFLKYAVVGGSGAILKYFLTSGLNYLFSMVIAQEKYSLIPSTMIAFCITVIWNFIWNEVWTFSVEDSETIKEEIKVPEDMDFSEFTLITPTFNENENIGQLMEVITKKYPNMKVIVADDGSTDGTREQVREFHEQNPDVVLLDREEEEVHGLTISVLDAIKMTTTKYYIVMDCDFQHPPEKVGEIAVRLQEGYDFVVGEREEIPDWPFRRRVISWGAAMIGKFSHFIHRSATCNDVMSGFFGGETSFSQKIIADHPKGFRPKGYKILFELLKHSPRKETEVGSVGYIFSPRERGESKISFKHITEFLKSAFP
ncbi:MAG: glycosyltransferase [Candidatus Heimdallarchaeota archaeon]|nr:glycosyltransferase [Candidatus Heimdallarchaeota archaeon]